MRSVLRCAAGVVLATGVLGLARPALAQPSSAYMLRGRQNPIRMVQYEENTPLSEGHSRLEEMKVQLALLADVATFPCYLGARAAGDKLDVRGYVPNDLVKQRALAVARRATFLNVTDGLKIQTNLSLRPPLRGVEVLQKEGAALLAKNLGEAGRLMRLEARPNGLVTVSGLVDSVEEKVAVSRLFRQLSGCSGVVNQLTVPAIIQDGRRVVPLTKDGSLAIAASALGMEAEPIVPPPTAPRLRPIAPMPLPEVVKPAPAVPPQKKAETLPRKEPLILPAPLPTLPPPAILPSRSLDAKDGELQLPKVLPAKPVSALPPSPKSIGRGSDTTSKSSSSTVEIAPKSPDAAMTPKPSPKWGRSAIHWESEKEKTTAKPVKITVTPSAGYEYTTTSRPADTTSQPAKTPQPAKTNKPVQTSKPETFTSDAKPSSADALQVPTPPAKWGRGLPSELPAPAKPPTPVAPRPLATPASRTGAAVGPIPITPKPPAAPVNAPPVQPAPQPAKPSKPVQTSKPETFASDAKPSSADAPQVPTPPAKWGRGLPSELPASAKPTTPVAPRPLTTPAPMSGSAVGPIPIAPKPTTAPVNAPPVQPARRWPPAYDVRQPEPIKQQPSSVRPPAAEKGRPGVITFEEEPTPAPAARPSPTGMNRPIVPADLQRKVASICGRQARDVRVEMQRDGSVLVRVTTLNAAVQNQMIGKILTIPEMTAGNVRLSVIAP